MEQFDPVQIGYQIGMYFVPFLFALCFHEFSHGLVAKWKGDNTAERMGRLSLSPFAHADMLGTWILPLLAIVTGTHFMFGWAKPVPVEVRNLKKPKQDMFWISLAGPGSNVFLALVATLVLTLIIAFSADSSTSHALTLLASNFIVVNIFLAIFNLIPVHPLDGAKVLAPFLPVRANYWLEQHQSQLSIVLFIAVLTVGWVLAVPVHYISEHLLDGALLMAEKLHG